MHVLCTIYAGWAAVATSPNKTIFTRAVLGEGMSDVAAYVRLESLKARHFVWSLKQQIMTSLLFLLKKY